MTKRVLVIRFSSMGDLILTTGPLARLRKFFPKMEMDLLTSAMGQELFINSIETDKTIVVDKGASLLDLVGVYRKLNQYDIIIDLQGNFKSHFLKLFQKADFFRIEKHSKERRAYVKIRKYKDQLQDHVVEKYYQTIRKAFPEIPDLTAEELRPVFVPQPLTFDREHFDFARSIVIHPFASQKNKEWPYFENLVENLVGYKTPVTLIGHSDEDFKTPDSPLVMNLINKTTLREMASILKTGRVLITTDSGPMHMGIAVNTPTIALFGPTTKELGFKPRFKNTWTIEEDLDCRPCHVHGGDVCPLGHHNCMKNIDVQRVKHQLEKILQK